MAAGFIPEVNRPIAIRNGLAGVTDGGYGERKYRKQQRGFHRCSASFMVPMHSKKRKEATHEPSLGAPASRRLLKSARSSELAGETPALPGDLVMAIRGFGCPDIQFGRDRLRDRWV